MASLKSKFKSVVSTAKNKVTSAIKKVSSSLGASVASSQNQSKAPTVKIPSVPAGPQSKIPSKSSSSYISPTAKYTQPTAAQQNTVNQLKNTVAQLTSQLKTGPNQSYMPPNQSTIPSPSSTQFFTDPKTGKKTYGKVNQSGVPQKSVQQIVDEATGGVDGPQSKIPSSGKSSSLYQSLSTQLLEEGYSEIDIQAALDEAGVLPGDETNMSFARSSSSSSGGGSSSVSGTGVNNDVSESNGGGGASGGSSALDELRKARENADKVAKEAEDLYKKDQTAASDIVSSDESVIRDEADAMTKLKDTDLTPTKESLRLLDAEIRRNEEQLNNELQSIGGAFDAQKAGDINNQAGEAGQLAMGIAGAGGFLGFSGSGAGVMLKLAESHRAELNLLESQRQRALTEARAAAAERRFDIVQLKAKEIARIDQETYDRTEAYNTRVRKEAEAGALKATKLKEQSDIFGAIKGGAKTVEQIFNKLGGTVDVDTINDMLENVSSGSGSFKFSAAQTAGLIGAGMGLDDISAFNEYVSENGYDATIKGMLTPGQRAAADKIFTTGAVGSGTGGGFTAQEQRKLEQAGLLRAPRQDQLDYLYGSKGDTVEYKSPYTSQILEGLTTIDSLPRELQAAAREDLNELGFATDNVPEWYQDYTDVSNMQSTSPDILKSEWTTFRKTALGEPIVTEEESDGPWWKFWD